MFRSFIRITLETNSSRMGISKSFQGTTNFFNIKHSSLLYDLFNKCFCSFLSCSPTVIEINGFPVEYDNFYNSLKAIGNVDNEVLNAYVQVFNYENENPDSNTKDPSKYCFSSYFMVILYSSSMFHFFRDTLMQVMFLNAMICF